MSRNIGQEKISHRQKHIFLKIFAPHKLFSFKQRELKQPKMTISLLLAWNTYHTRIKPPLCLVTKVLYGSIPKALRKTLFLKLHLAHKNISNSWTASTPPLGLIKPQTTHIRRWFLNYAVAFSNSIWFFDCRFLGLMQYTRDPRCWTSSPATSQPVKNRDSSSFPILRLQLIKNAGLGNSMNVPVSISMKNQHNGWS